MSEEENKPSEEVESKQNEKDESENIDEIPKKSSSNKKIIILLSVLSLVIAGSSIGITLLLLGTDETPKVAQAPAPSNEKEEKANKVAEAEPTKVNSERGEAIYYQIKPVFIVNFQGRSKAKYLQVQVQLMTRKSDAIEVIKKNLPLIKNDLIGLFSAQRYVELLSREGKEDLRKKSLEAVQNVLFKEVGDTLIEDVLFTSFVMQ